MIYIIYYTDSQLDPEIAEPCRKNLLRAAQEIPIISISQEPLDFGVENICVGRLKRKIQSMDKQIMCGCQNLSDYDYVFLCEHDVMYHPSYFSVLPYDQSRWLFNLNRWFYWPGDGVCCKDKRCNRRTLSQAVMTKKQLVEAYIQRGKTWNDRSVPSRLYWESLWPNIDIRHGHNLSKGHLKRRLHKLGIKKNITEVPGWVREGRLFRPDGDSRR